MPRNLFAACAVLAVSAPLAAQCEPTLVFDGPIRRISFSNVSVIGDLDIVHNATRDEFFVTWSDDRNGGQRDVWAQRLDQAGAPIGSNISIASGPSDRTETAVAWNPAADEYLVTWRYGGPVGSDHAFGRIVSGAGVPIGVETAISQAGTESSLVYNATQGEFFHTGRPLSQPPVVVGQRVSTLGVPLGGEIQLNDSGVPTPAGDVAWSSASDLYLTTWGDLQYSAVDARLLSGTGVPLANERVVSETYPGWVWAACTAYDPGRDRFLIAYRKESTLIGQSAVRLLSPTTGFVGPERVIANDVNYWAPRVAYDPASEAYLLVQHRPSGVVSLHALDGDGMPAGDPLPIGTVFIPDYPVVAADSAGGAFLVAWADSREVLDQYDVYVQRVLVQPAPCTTFCACVANAPCGNADPVGGCLNSFGTSGVLEGGGSSSVADETFVLFASGLGPTAPALYFQGTAQQNGGAGDPFGDGLRCVGGTVLRLATKTSVAGASNFGAGISDPPVSVQGQVPATGGLRHYQVWYRNDADFCTPAGFNLTNGVSVAWTP